MLVLFTSYEMLKEAYTNLKNDEELEGYLLLTQSVNNKSRSRLIRKFQEFDKSILLGTSSFGKESIYREMHLVVLLLSGFPLRLLINR